MKNYFLISHDYKFKQSIILQQCSKYDGLHLIEEYCERLVREYEGDKDIKYYLSTDTNRQYGYFIEKDIENLNKLTVKHKYIKYYGFLSNTVAIENIISYQLAEVINESHINFEVGILFDCNEKYKLCIDEILKTVKKIEPQEKITT